MKFKVGCGDCFKNLMSSGGRFLLAGAFLIALLATVVDEGHAATHATKEVVCGGQLAFDDFALQQAIRDAIQKPFGFIMQEDVDGLTVLPASNWGITALGGIECLPR